MSNTTTRIPVPSWRICDKPLTDNELDTEPGAEPSYYSAHMACTSESRDGRYVIVTFRDGVQVRSIQGASGYAHERRAREQAIQLADWNQSRYVFKVWDRTERTYGAFQVGALPELAR